MFDGYQIQYATDAKFTQNVSMVMIGDKKTYERTITGLKSGTTYYVRIRSYYVFEDLKYFGEWSNVLSTKVK